MLIINLSKILYLNVPEDKKLEYVLDGDNAYLIHSEDNIYILNQR